MANKSTISISFRVDQANGGFKKLSINSSEMREIMPANDRQAKEFSATAVNSSSISTAIDHAQNALNEMLNPRAGREDCRGAAPPRLAGDSSVMAPRGLFLSLFWEVAAGNVLPLLYYSGNMTQSQNVNICL